MHIEANKPYIKVWSASKQADRSRQARTKCEAQTSKQTSLIEADNPDRNAKFRQASVPTRKNRLTRQHQIDP